MTRWPHQIRAVKEAIDALNDNVRRLLLCSPTGGGKTRIALDLADEFTKRGLGVVLYTNRRMLVEQASRVLESANVNHGIRAAGHDTDQNELFQVSSIQTEDSRVTKRGSWQLHDAKLVLIDEAHLQTGPTVQKIVSQHVEAGAHVVGLTATPIGLAGYYDRLLVAGTTSELRAYGALVPARHFGPDEPDLKAWKKELKLKGDVETAELPESYVRKAMMTHGIFGRVFEWFNKLNSERKPTILFAPGVAESLWFAEQFTKAGVTAAHIDGSDVWVNGKLYQTSPQAREDVLHGSKEGHTVVLCNRFVLREGVDCPWLAHGIFATIFGSLQSYLQSGGRLLRFYPGLGNVTIQDHGGNWWRHGSLNADRTWRLSDTASSVTGLRADRLRKRVCRKCRARLECWGVCPKCGTLNLPPEPARCPRCFQVLTSRRCPCGWERTGKPSRMVVQSNGQLKEMTGEIFVPHRITKRTDGAKRWERMYWRSRSLKGRRTFKAAEALFAAENHWGWPDRRWPFMPLDDADFYLHVADVPMDRLIQKEVVNA
jgi:DNA repair protein RadD